jgi:hypothetical protein
MSDSDVSRHLSLIVRLVAFERSVCLVPGRPTPEQCAAGARAGNVSEEKARAVYRAMLAADELDC